MEDLEEAVLDLQVEVFLADTVARDQREEVGVAMELSGGNVGLQIHQVGLEEVDMEVVQVEEDTVDPVEGLVEVVIVVVVVLVEMEMGLEAVVVDLEEAVEVEDVLLYLVSNVELSRSNNVAQSLVSNVQL